MGGGEDSMAGVCQGGGDDVQAGSWQGEAWDCQLVSCQPEQPCVFRNACAEASAETSSTCTQGSGLCASLCHGAGGTFGTSGPSFTFFTDDPSSSSLLPHEDPTWDLSLSLVSCRRSSLSILCASWSRGCHVAKLVIRPGG